MLSEVDREFLRRVRDDDSPMAFLRQTTHGYGWAVELGYIRQVGPHQDFKITATGLLELNRRDSAASNNHRETENGRTNRR